MSAGSSYTYEVALSFAGEQRDYVRDVNDALKTLGVKTFYDDDYAVDLWGKNHTEELPRIYAEDSHLVLMFISEQYVDKRWPRHERRAILTEMTQRASPYLLPVRFDDSPVPGLDSACHYLEASRFTSSELADAAYAQLVALGVRTARAESASLPGLSIEILGLNGVVCDDEEGQFHPLLPLDLAQLLSRPVSKRAEDIQRALAFGASQPVEMPAAQAKLVEGNVPISGLSSLRIVLQPQSIAHLKGKAVGLRLFDEQKQHLGTYTGVVMHAGLGEVGTAVEFHLAQGLNVILCVPCIGGQEGSITTGLTLEGLDPESVRRCTGMLLALHQASTAEIELDGHALSKVEAFAAGHDEAYLRAVQMVYEAADDLAFIQNATGVYFPMPDEIESSERLWMRSIRLMLEGHAAPIPRRTFHGTANPDFDANSSSEEGAVAIRQSGQNVSLAGHPIPVPPFFIYHPHVMFTGVRESVEDATRGIENPRQFEVRPVEESAFVAYFPDRLRPDAMRSTPWGLTGVVDPLPTTLNRGS